MKGARSVMVSSSDAFHFFCTILLDSDIKRDCVIYRTLECQLVTENFNLSYINFHHRCR